MPGNGLSSSLDAAGSYLIRIGWSNDEAEAKIAKGKVEKSLLSIKKQADKFTGALKSIVPESVLKFGGATTKSLASVVKLSYDATKWMFRMSDAIAEQDLQAEKLARRWGITEKAARSYTKALEVMGLDVQRMSEVWKMTDEEYARFQNLQSTLQKLEPGKNFQEFSKTFRDVSFEASKFNAQLASLREHFLGGMFNGSRAFFKELRSDLQSLNNWVSNNGARIAEKVGSFFSKIVNFLHVWYRMGKNIISWFVEMSSRAKSLGDVFKTFLSPIIRAYEYLEDLVMWVSGTGKTYLGHVTGGTFEDFLKGKLDNNIDENGLLGIVVDIRDLISGIKSFLELDFFQKMKRRIMGLPEDSDEKPSWWSVLKEISPLHRFGQIQEEFFPNTGKFDPYLHSALVSGASNAGKAVRRFVMNQNNNIVVDSPARAAETSVELVNAAQAISPVS